MYRAPNDTGDLLLKDTVAKRIEASKVLNIVIVGEYQVGKSTLIRALLSLKGTKMDMAEYSLHSTKDVRVQKIQMEKATTVNIYEPPGFQGESNDLKYMQVTARECPNIHLIIYCKRMGENMTEIEKNTFKNLNQAFGGSVWNKLIIALTFANLVDPPDPGADVVEYFKEIKARNIEDFNLTFKEFNIKDQLIKRVHIYPVGSAKVLHLPGMAEDWRTTFWKGCLDACNEEGRETLLNLAGSDSHSVVKVTDMAVDRAEGAGCVKIGIKLFLAGIYALVGANWIDLFGETSTNK